MNNEELKNESSENKIGKGSNPVVLLAIVIFLIIVIVIGSIIQTGSFW